MTRPTLDTPQVKALFGLLAEMVLEAQADVLEASTSRSHPALGEAAGTLNEVAVSLTRLSSGKAREVLREFYDDTQQ